MGKIDLLVIFTTAFLGSFGHCIGMCGGIVVAYSSKKLDEKTPLLRQQLSHLSYNLGRVTTYAILGAIFGFFGKVIAFTTTTKGVLFVLTGVLMILAALSLLGNFRFLASAELALNRYAWFRRLFGLLLQRRDYPSFYLLGMLNGLIPCGLVYSFAIIAASSASPLWGAIVMASFGLATVPALFFLGNLTKLLQQGNLRTVMLKLAALLVLFYGGFVLYKGYRFIVHPKQMQQMVEKMHSSGKCSSMRCAPGKCG